MTDKSTVDWKNTAPGAGMKSEKGAKCGGNNL